MKANNNSKHQVTKGNKFKRIFSASALIFTLATGTACQNSAIPNTSSSDSQVVSASKTGTTKAKSIKYYKGFPNVPDFGAIYGISPSKTDKSGDTAVYFYSLANVQTEDIEEYIGILTDNGFTYSPYFSENLGEIDGVTVISLINGSSVVSLCLHEIYGFFIMVS